MPESNIPEQDLHCHMVLVFTLGYLGDTWFALISFENYMNIKLKNKIKN